MNSIKKLAYAILIYCSITVVCANELQTDLNSLTIITEEYPPISFKNKNGKADGLASEVAYTIMKRLKMKQNIKILPWSRGYSLTKKGPNYLLFSVGRTDIREKLFQWVGPIYFMKSSFYVKKDSKIKILSLEYAKKIKRIGINREAFDEQYLKEQGFKNLKTANNDIAKVKTMMGGRYDVMVNTNVTLSATMKKAGYTTNDVKPIYSFMEVGVYFAFSKQVPKQIITAWKDELNKMKDNGELESIRQKWLK